MDIVPFGNTVNQTNVLSFARINVVSARILGGQTPLNPRPYAYARQSFCEHSKLSLHVVMVSGTCDPTNCDSSIYHHLISDAVTLSSLMKIQHVTHELNKAYR